MAGKNPVFQFAFDEDEQKFQEESSKGFAPIPRGFYHVVITDVKLEDYTDPSPYAGKKRLNLSVKVLTEDYAGRKINYVQIPLFARWNPSAKKPEGTATSFYDFTKALGLIEDGKLKVSDWNILFNKEVMAFIDIGKPKDDGRVFNEIKSFGGQWKSLEEADEEAVGNGDIEFGEPKEENPF